MCAGEINDLLNAGMHTVYLLIADCVIGLRHRVPLLSPALWVCVTSYSISANVVTVAAARLVVAAFSRSTRARARWTEITDCSNGNGVPLRRRHLRYPLLDHRRMVQRLTPRI